MPRLDPRLRHPGWTGRPSVQQPEVMTPLSTDDQLRLLVEEVRAIRKSLNRIYVLLLVPIVPFAAFVAGTVLRMFFPGTPFPFP